MKSRENYVFTERAHFMCPNMHFGIMAKIAGNYDEEKLRQSIETLQKAHPFLQSLIAEEADNSGVTGQKQTPSSDAKTMSSIKLFYQKQDSLEIPVLVKEKADLWQQDYEEISVCGWNVKKECMLKVVVYPSEAQLQMLFIAHHLLCDGRGLLQLVEEFAKHYVNGVAPQYVEECLIRDLSDLPSNSDLPFISKVVVGSANKNWEKEGKQVTYEEYGIFEKAFIQKSKTEREITTVGNKELEEIKALCKKHDVTINDYLIAKMMMEENTDKVVIAADIRDRVKCYRQGAMGNYSTAFSVYIKKKKNDVFSIAKQVSSKVTGIRKQPKKEMLVLACYVHMIPELIDAVAISTLGDFNSKAGMFVGKNMFGFSSRNGYSITNLGKIESNTITEAFFVPPASPANKKTWGVLTINNNMRICVVNSEL